MSTSSNITEATSILSVNSQLDDLVKSKAPFFLLLLEKGKLSENSIKVTTMNENMTEAVEHNDEFTQNENGPLEKAITTYISPGLKKLYNNDTSAASVSEESFTDNITDENIIKYYNDLNISTVGDFFSDKTLFNKSDGHSPDDATTIKELLADADYKRILIKYMMEHNKGGSRSMKKRRRHKQKKNKNTKRRSRK